MPKVAEAQSDITMPWFVEVYHIDGAYQRSFQTYYEANKFKNTLHFLKQYSPNEYWQTLQRVHLRGAYFGIN